MAKSATKKAKSLAKPSSTKKYSAEQQMQKWGWKSGQGLGKNNQGRKTFIRTKLKMDKSGLGNDTNEINKSDDPWWARAFNKTAKKIRKKAGESDVSSESESSSDENAEQEAGQEVNPKYDDCGRKLNSKKAVSLRIRNARREYMKMFKSAGLLNPDPILSEQVLKDKIAAQQKEAEEKQAKLDQKKSKLLKKHKKQKSKTDSSGSDSSDSSSSSSSDSDSSDSEAEKTVAKKPRRSHLRQMTDEELFAACGGRTAHRAAKFGLGLGGKLARIEAQEKKLLEKFKK